MNDTAKSLLSMWVLFSSLNFIFWRHWWDQKEFLLYSIGCVEYLNERVCSTSSLCIGLAPGGVKGDHAPPQLSTGFRCLCIVVISQVYNSHRGCLYPKEELVAKPKSAFGNYTATEAFASSLSFSFCKGIYSAKLEWTAFLVQPYARMA